VLRGAAALSLTTALVLSWSANPVGAQPGPQFDPDPPASEQAADIEVTQIEAEDGELKLSIEIPPAVAGGRLDVDAVGVIVDGSYVLASVERVNGDELTIVLAIDVSGSTAGEVLIRAIAAANAFVGSLPDGALVGVVSFGPEVLVVQAPTDDRVAVATALGSLTAEGATSLFDGTIAAVELVGTTQSSTRQVVVFSDGGDTASTAGLSEVIARATTADVGIDVVALESEEFSPDVLNTLAVDGRVWSVDSPEQIASAFGELGDRFGNQFVVTLPETAGEIVVVVRGDEGIRRVAVENSTVEEGPVGLGRTETTSPEIAAARLIPPASAIPIIAPLPDTVFGKNTLWLGLGAIAAGIFGAGATLAWPTRKNPNRTSLIRRHRSKPNRAEMVQRLSELADAGLKRTGKSKGLARQLEQSGSTLRAGEFVVLVGAIALGTMTVASVVVGPVVGLVSAVVVVIASKVRLSRRVKKVREQFGEQLGSTLQLLASNLRVGHGLLQSVDAVGQESESPTREEFRRVTGEVRLGRDVGGALRAMSDRLDNDDFRWVVQAIEIHRDVGGDLGEVLDNVGVTIRDRQRLKGQIESLSADGRISAAVMMALPFCVGAMMLATTPDYFDELTGRSAGRLLLAFGAVLMVSGGAWLKAIVRLDF